MTQGDLGTLTIPAYEFDLFSDEGILRPYGHYKTMRELGPVVYLPKQSCYAVLRYNDVRDVLMDSQRFISGRGISLNDTMNTSVAASIITSDGQQHELLRRLERPPMSGQAISELRTQVSNSARSLIRDLLSAAEELDAVRDIAHFCHSPS